MREAQRREAQGHRSLDRLPTSLGSSATLVSVIDKAPDEATAIERAIMGVSGGAQRPLAADGAATGLKCL